MRHRNAMTKEEARVAYGWREIVVDVDRFGRHITLTLDQMAERNACFYCAGTKCEVCAQTGKQSMAERLDKLESFK